MNGFISQESIDEVTSKTDIVNVIGEYVPLTQRGNSWWGCCPFHNEKTPSFQVNPDRKLFYCFGCHKGGTAITFVQEMEKLSFPESIEFLAKKAGVKLIYEEHGKNYQKDDTAYKLKEEYIELYTRVSTSFHYMLMETEAGKFALDYIKKRGLTDETLKKFKLGYSPADRRWLHSFLLKKNYSEEFLSKSGLFSKKYPEYAFFSDRLMFPIFNRNGKTVAMGGRFLRGDAEKSPKYLNSGDLIQYKKGETLYAFNFAKEEIRRQKRVIFCEGYMDCIAYHQCGITFAVAPLGTALTEEQIKIVKPFVSTILLSFDSDGAGQNATKRAVYMCRKAGIEVRVISLSGGKDPAEIMLKFGAKVLTDDVNNAILDSDFLLTKLLGVYSKKNSEDKLRASLEFFEYIDSLQSDVQKDECLKQLGQTYEIELEALKKDYSNRSQLSQRLRKVKTLQPKEVAEVQKIRLSAELRAVMTAVTDDVSLFSKMRNEISLDELEDPNAKKLFATMEECAANGSFSVSGILNRCDDEELKKVIFESIVQYSAHVAESVSDSIKLIKRNSLERKGRMLLRLINKLSKSSVDEDKVKLGEVLTEKMNIDKQIATLKE